MPFTRSLQLDSGVIPFSHEAGGSLIRTDSETAAFRLQVIDGPPQILFPVDHMVSIARRLLRIVVLQPISPFVMALINRIDQCPSALHHKCASIHEERQLATAVDKHSSQSLKASLKNPSL